MAGQRYYTKVQYNVGIGSDMFDPDHVLVKQKK
jgi:hypothetical protein